MPDDEIPGYVRRTVSDQRANYMRSEMAYGRAHGDATELREFLLAQGGRWFHWPDGHDGIRSQRRT